MSDILQNLNPAQLDAVTHVQGPLLIVAGAGTGKTTVLTRRYAHLLDVQGLKTDQILALTFTEKASTEMEDRVLSLLSTGTYDFWISTFHGFCQRVLEAHGLEIGLPNAFRVLTTTDAWILLKRHSDALPLDHYRPLGNPLRFLRSLLQHISRAKDEGVTVDAYRQFAEEAPLKGDEDVVADERKRLIELSRCYQAYRDVLLAEGCLDFGDLILETLRLFRERPAILDLYRKQFEHIMVDEFQDTNGAQYALLQLLTGTKRNLTVVGDDDQAIYKFRGASLANILQFRSDFPDAKTVALQENYRSRKEILDKAYAFIRRNDPHRLEVQLKDTGLSKELVAMRGDGGSVESFWEDTIDEEAEGIAVRIKEWKQAHPDASWNDVAVLVRSNDAADPFVQAFDRAGIPFQFMALRGLYRKPPVLDALAFLTLLDGYHESSAVWRVLSLPCYLFPARDRAELSQYAQRKGMSLWKALEDVVDGPRGLTVSDHGVRIARKIVADVTGLAEAARRFPPLRVFQMAMDQSGYVATVMRYPEREKRESLQWLNGFAERIKRFERSVHGPTVKGFLEEFHIELESGEEGALDADTDSGPDLAKILTVHAAKGLEFSCVCIVSLVDQRFPTRARPDAIPLPEGLIIERAPEGDYHLEEERRLMYVAMTRAKDAIICSGASHYGGTRAKKPSIFWEEAGIDLPDIATTQKDEARSLVPPKEQAESEAYVERKLYPLKRRFSFTQLAAFNTCPLQYKFAHVYRIPVLGGAQKSFGQSMHLTLQRVIEAHLERGRSAQASLFDAGGSSSFSANAFRLTEEEALEIYEASWIGEWYESEARQEEYKERGRQAVRHFLQKCSTSPPDVLEVEKDFTLLLGEHSVKGKIDRVDRLADGSVAVVDYKTGRTKETLSAEDKEQLHLYQIALEERGLRVGRLAYLFVLEGKEIEVDPLLGEKRQAFIEKITHRMDAVLMSEYPAKPDANVCKYCDFRNICEFRA